MGSNNNKNKNTPQAPGQYPNYGPNPGQSGQDPRGRAQNQSQYQQQRYENQQGPVTSAMARNYGQGTEQGMNDYSDIMSSYRNYVNPQQPQQMRTQGTSPQDVPGGDYEKWFRGLVGDQPWNQQTFNSLIPQFQQHGINITPPNAVGDQTKIQLPNGQWVRVGFGEGKPVWIPQTDTQGRSLFGGQGSSGNPIQGFQRFADTGGYSPQDMSNLRARGVSPIRAAYANAEREVGRQRSLQGGYAPNAIATQAKMAREQGQSMADATQNVEAGIVNQRNANMLSGLGGGQQGILGALGGQSGLYGATPGMASTFGNQLLQGVGQGGDFGLGLLGRDISSQQLPGQFDTTMGKIGGIANLAGSIANPILDYYSQKRKQGSKGDPQGTGG